MKDISPITTGGLFLSVVSLTLLLLGFQFSALSFCAGYMLLGFCVGLTVNYTWVVWTVLLIVGAFIVVFSRRRR
ncbi:MAG TPA: hypothetical protein VGS11_10800 [Candidatus Bathyarchaeia archaeon]|nr:hypothetical protein [Candidatus Bathyarchaeia archaeon]